MTIDQAQESIIRQFSELDDWFDKYQHLVGLGRQHDGLDDGYKTDRYALPGCESQVWIRSEQHDGRLRFFADSDSMIVRGILSLLLRVLDDQPPEQIANADVHFLKDIGVSSSLSPTRANGVAQIIRLMKQCAAESAECCR